MLTQNDPNPGLAYKWTYVVLLLLRVMKVKLTCLCLDIFMFDSECFFNLHIFTLVFNKRHLSRMSRSLSVFRLFVMSKI